MIDIEDHENVDTTTNSSLIRVIVGGKAKLVKLTNSHHVAIGRRIVGSLWAKIIVRLWIHS